MKWLERISTGLILLGAFTLTISTGNIARSQFSALDDIKGRLESEGIEVVDYSNPENLWGSISSEWQNYLKGKSYTGLRLSTGWVAGSESQKPLYTDFESLYIGSETSLIPLRRRLANYEAIKSRLTDADEIASIEAMINGGTVVTDLTPLGVDAGEGDYQDGVKPQITEQEEKIKNAIRSKISDAASSGLNIEEGVNLIFRELEFYFTYSKWGVLPTRLIIILERHYDSLQTLSDDLVPQGDEFNPYDTETLILDIDEDLSKDDAQLIMDSLAILNAPGESQINLIARAVANTIKNILIGIAVIWIIYAGARMVFAQGDENVITEQKRALIYAGFGLVSVLLVDRGINYLYGPAGVERTTLVKDAGFSTEIYGLIHFAETIMGVVAILFIVISGVRILFASGEEDTIKKQRSAVLWIGIGLILIAIDEILVKQFFIIPTQQSDQIRTSNVTTIINTVGGVIQFILGFTGLIAFGILIYGAATMVMNYGNDEMVEKSKKIIRNAIIGILVILSSYAIVATLVVFR